MVPRLLFPVSFFLFPCLTQLYASWRISAPCNELPLRKPEPLGMTQKSSGDFCHSPASCIPSQQHLRPGSTESSHIFSLGVCVCVLGLLTETVTSTWMAQTGILSHRYTRQKFEVKVSAEPLFSRGHMFLAFSYFGG